ncbi:MAG: chromate transporter [Culicoidibacterales bacterium]
MILLRDVFWSALKIACLSFGGGVSALPTIYDEYVTRRQWFDDESFQYFVTVSNALPGPIISQLIVMMSYDKRGIVGGVISFLTITFTGPLMLIALFALLYAYVPFEIVEKLSFAVGPTIIAMLVIFIWQQLQKSQRLLGWKSNGVLLGVAALTMVVLNWNIAIIFITTVILILLLTPNKERGEQ